MPAMPKKLRIALVALLSLMGNVLWGQDNPPIDILDEEDIYHGTQPPMDYIDLPVGTVIARDTSLITPVINDKEIFYSQFQERYILVAPDPAYFSIDSIVIREINTEQRIYIYCTDTH